MPDGLSRHRSIHLQTLTDHRGCDEPGLPAGTARWPSYVFGLGDLPIFFHRSPPHSDVKPIVSNPMSVFLGFQTLFKLPMLPGSSQILEHVLLFRRKNETVYICRNSTPLDYQFRNLSILRCGKLPDVLHLFSHKMDLNNVQTLHLAGIPRSNIFHQLQVASRWICSFFPQKCLVDIGCFTPRPGSQ